MRGLLQFPPRGTSDRIDELHALVDAGILRGVSVGFRPTVAKPIKDGGTHFLRQTLVELGYEASDQELAECYRRVTSLADESKQIRARDIMSIAHQVIRRKAVTAEASPAA